MTSIKCDHCGGTVLHTMCQLCGKIFTEEYQLAVHDRCDHIVKTTDWTDCLGVQGSMILLGEVLTTHHHLLVQGKQRLLQHAGHCSSCRQAPLHAGTRQEMRRLRELLLPGSQGIGWRDGEPWK